MTQVKSPMMSALNAMPMVANIAIAATGFLFAGICSKRLAISGLFSSMVLKNIICTKVAATPATTPSMSPLRKNFDAVLRANTNANAIEIAKLMTYCNTPSGTTPKIVISVVTADTNARMPIHFQFTMWATKKGVQYTPRTDEYTLAFQFKPVERMPGAK